MSEHPYISKEFLEGADKGTVEKLGSLEKFNMELGRLTDIIERLDTVLTPIMAPLGPNTSPSTEPFPMSTIRSQTDHFEKLNDRLSSLLHRIDL